MSTYQCNASNPCRSDMCCGADGYCSKSAKACSVADGCLGGCKDIPSPSSCSTYNKVPSAVFNSTLFPNINAANTIPMQVTPVRSSSVGVCATKATYALKPCDLVDIMGGPEECPHCLYYYDNLREAVEMYDMNALDCNASGVGSTRLANFLAQIKHETASLGTLFQPADNGAGSIHMIPFHFATAIHEIPRLKSAFENEDAFDDVNTLSLADLDNAINNNATLQRRIGLFIQRPENAFLTAGWWYIRGAQERLNPSCGDLRSVADAGTGSPSGPTGYYKVSQCIFGPSTDAGLSERVSSYQAALGYASKYSSAYTRSGMDPPSSGNGSGGSGNGNNIGGGSNGSGGGSYGNGANTIGSSNNYATLVGIVVGIILALLIVVGLLSYVFRRRRSWTVELPFYSKRSAATVGPLQQKTSIQGAANNFTQKILAATNNLVKPAAPAANSSDDQLPIRTVSVPDLESQEHLNKTPRSSSSLQNLPPQVRRPSQRGSRTCSSYSLRELAARNSIMKVCESENIGKGNRSEAQERGDPNELPEADLA